MLVHGDFSFADLCALTRERRREAAMRRETVRYSVEPKSVTPEFETVIDCTIRVTRRKGSTKRWRHLQWHIGNRRCFYCEVTLIHPRKCWEVHAPNAATVDHRHPLALGGDDAPWNWAMCCWTCNNRKGAMTEAEFRSLLAAQLTGDATSTAS